MVRFARDELGHPLDPWQEFSVIHAGELLEDGRPRFRKVLLLVSRQNGKTELCVVLALYWLFVECVGVVLGTSTKLPYAAISWQKAYRLAKRIPKLSAEIPKKGGIRKANGEQVLWRADADEFESEGGSRYWIAASNEEGGRSLTVDRLVLDELRQHHDYSAWDASEPATSAVWDAQIWALSNMGSDKAVVLNDMRDEALRFIETGEGDSRLGLIEYSAPEGSSPLDPVALAQANPNAGRRLNMGDLLTEAAAAMRVGGDKLAGFKTEKMCMRVPRMDPAVDPEGWAACLDLGDLSDVRSRVALCVDLSLDEQHATLVAAAMLPDERVRVEVVAAWEGEDCTRQLRRDLPGHVKRVKPQKFGWFPAGPAAAVAANLADRKGHAGWPPAGVEVDDIRGEVTEVCMEFGEQVKSASIAQSDDPLLNAQVIATEKSYRRDAWVFTRKGTGHCDGTYAAAGAVHLARTLPSPVPKPLVV